jgi:hypothetical protein
MNVAAQDSPKPKSRFRTVKPFFGIGKTGFVVPEQTRSVRPPDFDHRAATVRERYFVRNYSSSRDREGVVFCPLPDGRGSMAYVFALNMGSRART